MSRASQLESYLASVEPFSWGSYNCCHFVAHWVREMTGYDPMHGLPPTQTRLEAYKLIRSLGGTLQSAWSLRMGEPILPTLAQIGDVVLVALADGGAAVGICLGTRAAFVTIEGKVVDAPMARATSAWRLQRELR